ncbi:hypothetical protein FACS1894174_06000 [Bacteroidia bacterium]|nr:hypothetical protein FACS1894203_3960 [Bacteroidia bacterium]GHU87635.1 hypothetical protein FACS1894155_00980 [Bacteroidia bacterium]GHV21946.1 hypothetical protein FACS1894174_06000 [Bacteroidia bacterium]
MAKKSPKISYIERLHIQKIRLKAEADAHLQALDNHWDYLQNNFGALILGSAFQAVRSKLPPVFSGLFSTPEEKHKDKKTAGNKSSNLAVTAGTLLDMALDVVPLFFKGRKPVIIAYVLRELKNLLFKKN